MSHIALVYRSRLAFRFALIGVSASVLAGCAGSERMADPFSNPFSTAQAPTDPAPTSSINPGAPVTPVQSRPLAAASSQRPAVVASLPAHGAQGPAGWTAAGGTPISIAQGESADLIARRYGVPTDALLKANGFSNAAQVQPGARVIIPVYHAVGAPMAVAQAPAAAPVSAPKPARTPDEMHAQKIKLLKGAPATQQFASASANSAAKSEKLGAPPRSAAFVPETPKKTAEAAAKAAAAQPAVSTKAASIKTEPVKTAALTKADTPKAETAKSAAPAVEAKAAAEDEGDSGKAAGANPEFRWPARGRIIQAFKPGGNDGINIAVPEGTSVKAAESGVVAYAGSELKGYGNLILIRHPNGFVSAYANNGDIEVKRGETVKRGQTIAKSGQSGNVASPQLHFELRKGATPVDPTQYLAGL
ncbi:Peptidase M23 [Methylocella silvestris BL2]|uniref:Peptidase M23 n=1 Tax=Methylocella silvestris (strain DSM 15510 / CIP 108128 / LMG 27833 / NCIMB 13906 / BL2) TaxID=395965 RepID=B8ERC2_METSB|nr:peptidoglycan DD-metalloendopeptidase family protein [Methylocella silvestris]ACK50306.1 Peptidase M23 [Methylocella silvestris BL2]